MFFKIKKSYWAFLEAMPSKSFHRNGVHYRWIFGNKNIMDQQFPLCVSSVLSATRIITAICWMWPIYNGSQNHPNCYATQKLSHAVELQKFFSIRVSIEKKPYLMLASHTSCCSLCQWYNFVLTRLLSIRGNEIQVGCNEYRQEISLLFIGSKKLLAKKMDHWTTMMGGHVAPYCWKGDTIYPLEHPDQNSSKPEFGSEGSHSAQVQVFMLLAKMF